MRKYNFRSQSVIKMFIDSLQINWLHSFVYQGELTNIHRLSIPLQYNLIQFNYVVCLSSFVSLQSYVSFIKIKTHSIAIYLMKYQTYIPPSQSEPGSAGIKYKIIRYFKYFWPSDVSTQSLGFADRVSCNGVEFLVLNPRELLVVVQGWGSTILK